MNKSIEISGYRPGALAAILKLHMAYYSKHWKFGLPFETKVASELAHFLMRKNDIDDSFLSAYDSDGALVGSITIDALHKDTEGAHLRWFIVSSSVSGSGVGRELLERALSHCDNKGYHETYLTTFQGLDAARALYDSVGFELVSESDGDQWQGGVVEQRFSRRMTPA